MTPPDTDTAETTDMNEHCPDCGHTLAEHKAWAGAEKGIESVKTGASDAKVVDLTEREPAHNQRLSRRLSSDATKTLRVAQVAVRYWSIPTC
jgi:hypothetical protein